MKNIKSLGHSFSKNEKELAIKREKELVEDLSVLEGYIAALWEVLPIPVCVVNGAFIVLEAGNFFFNLFSFNREEIIGESLSIIFQNYQDFEKIKNILEREGKVTNYEAILKTKDSIEIIVFISAVLRKKQEIEEEPDGYIFSFADITSLKKAQQELKEKVIALEKFEKLVVGRELKMIELKNKLKEKY